MYRIYRIKPDDGHSSIGRNMYVSANIALAETCMFRQTIYFMSLHVSSTMCSSSGSHWPKQPEHMFPRTYKIHQEQQSPKSICPTHSKNRNEFGQIIEIIEMHFTKFGSNIFGTILQYDKVVCLINM